MGIQAEVKQTSLDGSSTGYTEEVTWFVNGDLFSVNSNPDPPHQVLSSVLLLKMQGYTYKGASVQGVFVKTGKATTECRRGFVRLDRTHTGNLPW